MASRGTWSLGLFIIANWQDLSAFFQQESKQKDANAPPKQEEELVQLNIALQKEIVRFTALGIQRAVRDAEHLSQNSKVRISSLSIPFNFFVRISSNYFEIFCLIFYLIRKPSLAGMQFLSSLMMMNI